MKFEGNSRDAQIIILHFPETIFSLFCNHFRIGRVIFVPVCSFLNITGVFCMLCCWFALFFLLHKPLILKTVAALGAACLPPV